jgi:ABC-2 type transport system permease protein
MRAFWQLTLANIRSYLRDRAALFWTLAFPLIFILLFGFIFSAGNFRIQVGWSDADGSSASAALRDAFASIEGIELVDGTEEEVLEGMRTGAVDAAIVVPDGYGEALAAAQAGSGVPATVTLYTDASNAQGAATITQIVNGIMAAVNMGGRPPFVVAEAETLQTQDLNAISYFVPSILGLSVMQVGVFAAIPLVADREKLILKRLNATPLRRWQLVGSNVAMRILIAIFQAVVIVAVGTLLFGVETTGSWVLTGVFVVLGALAFLALGYVIASFAPTEDAANGMTQVVQFPMMFLSGTFFQLDQMPEFLQQIARLIPLTYLSDALRQVMVDGAAFAPLTVCAAVLLGWLVVCFGIAARFFKWQ